MVSNQVLDRVLAGCVLLFIATPLLLYEAESGVTMMASQERSSVVPTWPISTSNNSAFEVP